MELRVHLYSRISFHKMPVSGTTNC